jgi:hypothetical protein
VTQGQFFTPPFCGNNFLIDRWHVIAENTQKKLIRRSIFVCKELICFNYVNPSENKR